MDYLTWYEDSIPNLLAGRGWEHPRRAEALAGLALETLQPLWAETLPVLAARGRKDLLSDLRALAPVLDALGGKEAVGRCST